VDLSNIKGIIFDAEGVVVDTEILWDKSQDILLEKRGLKYDRDYLKPRMAGQTLLEGAQLMVDYYKLDEDPSDIAQERNMLIHDLFEHDIRYINGFMPFVEQLNGSPLKKGIATAMKRSLMTKVEAKLRLQDIFGQHIYYIEDVGNRSKPEPDVFLHAAEKMHLDPHQCIVIEDAPHGIEAAKRAGMFAVGLVTTFTRSLLYQADYTAEDFESALLFFRKSGLEI
jgi:HAD superfamily hydrolase (TIGR01509 family)